MEINLSKLLKQEPGEIAEFELNEEVAIPDRGRASVQGQVKLTHLDQSILASFDVIVSLSLICDKCLESFRHQIPLRFDREYLLHGSPSDDESLTIKQDELDTVPALTQEILVNLPLQAVCKPDCKGLDPKSGENLNQTDGSTTKKEDK